MFLDKYGTHAIVSGKFGGKIVVKSEIDARCWAECGIEGSIKFVPGQGWCNSG
jgi:hypothetical protein